MTKYTTSAHLSRWLKRVGVLLSFIAVGFSILSYLGFWGWLRGDDLLARLSDRLDTSYAEEVPRQVRPQDLEWRPLLRIIERYTRTQLLADKKPLVFARAQAIFSAKTNEGEWTAPSTPIVLFYRDWPAVGTGPFLRGKDFVTVGTIGDLHEWIRRDIADFDFLWQTITFGLLSACVGLFLLISEERKSFSWTGVH